MQFQEISEESLQVLVPAFYARVRRDPDIGPIFEAAIDDWPAHLDKLQAFWSSVMLGSGRYKGRPLPAHLRHADAITDARFARWLALWRESTVDLFVPEAAAALQEKAARIAESLSLGIAFNRDGASGLLDRPSATA